MNYNSSVSSLLERLRAHALWQEQERVLTTAMLRNNPTLQSQKIENNEMGDSSELPISNKELDFLKPLHHKLTTNEIGTKNISACDESYLSFGDIVSSNYVDPLIEKSSNVNDRSKVSESASKFNYLRKCQGLKRYNSKKLKGFHSGISNKTKELSNDKLKFKSVLLSKKNPDSLEQTDNKKTCPEVTLAQTKNISNNNSPNKLTHRNFDAFEVLEELVEHDSFISTSSRVNYLFQDDCSTPVPMRKSSFESIDLTPIAQPNEKGLVMAMSKQVIEHHLTPVRTLFSGHVQQSCGFERNIQSCQDYTSVTAQISKQGSLSIKCDNKCAEGNYQSGILKKCMALPTLHSSLAKSSNSGPKVHFPNYGAKILEYDQDPEETISETICSGDTDLVNISDLENLKYLGLNYNFGVVHEVSSSDNKNVAVNQILQKTSVNLMKSQIYESPKLCHKPFPNTYPEHTKVSIANILPQSFKSIKNLDILGSRSNTENLQNNMQPTKTSMEPKVESVQLKHLKHDSNNKDIEVNKLLLLSKVYDLKKEIKMFKCKNETMDKLIKELEEEKKNLIHSQQKEKHQKTNMTKYVYNNVKKKINNVPICNNDVNQKIIKLNERICNLKTENNLLKRKVVSLKSKESDLKSKESELIKKPSAVTTADSSKIDLRKCNSSFSAGKENIKNVSLVTNKKAINQNLKADAMEVSSVKEIGASDVLESDTNNGEIPSSIETATPNLTTFSLENNNTPLSTKHLPNGDEQINYLDKIIYFYSKEKITHTRFKEGKEIIEFETGQKEIYFRDGSHQIIFPNKSCISVYGDGSQKIVSVDGTSTHIKKDGTKVIEFPNGQKEIYQNDIIKRIYPDGTVKILYADGMQETRYKNGQIRIKTEDGKVIMR